MRKSRVSPGWALVGHVESPVKPSGQVCLSKGHRLVVLPICLSFFPTNATLIFYWGCHSFLILSHEAWVWFSLPQFEGWTKANKHIFCTPGSGDWFRIEPNKANHKTRGDICWGFWWSWLLLPEISEVASNPHDLPPWPEMYGEGQGGRACFGMLSTAGTYTQAVRGREGERRGKERETERQRKTERKRKGGALGSWWGQVWISLDCSVMWDNRLSLLFKPVRVVFSIAYNIVT